MSTHRRLVFLVPLVVLALVGGLLAVVLSSPTTAAPRTRDLVSGSTTTTQPPAPSTSCVTYTLGWSLPRLLDQLLMVQGTFTQAAALAPEASAGVGALELAFAPGEQVTSSPTSAGWLSAGLAQLTADAAGAGQAAPIVATDAEGGQITRVAEILGALRSPRQMATTWTSAYVEQVMATRGAQMRALGFTADLAPMLTIAAPTDTIGLESTRAFSTSPTVAGAYGVAFYQGLRTAGLLAVGQIFPGDGYADADTDTGPATDPPLATLRASDLVPFEDAIAAGISALMVGSAAVPGLTDGLPASLSPATYSLLRGTLGFTGMTVTDSLVGGATRDAGYSGTAAVVASIEAGADMPMLGIATWQPALDALEQAVAQGQLSMSAVRTRVGHVLTAKGLCQAGTDT